MIVTIYDPASGRIASVLEVSDPEAALQNIPDGMLAIEGRYDPDQFYVDANDEPVEMPERPGEWAVFDYTTKTWTDPRPAPDLAAVKNAAVQAINAARGAARCRFITNIPGQEMVYLEKEAEARSWVAARAAADAGSGPPPGLPDFPHIASEIGPTAPDADGVAQVYLNLAAQFRSISATIEWATMRAIADVESAADTGEASAIAAEFPGALLAALGG